MKNILQELWDGNFYPAEACACKNEAIKELELLIAKHHEKLLDLLDTKGGEMLEAYADRYGDLLTLYGEQAFCEGFCLAAKALIEVMK